MIVYLARDIPAFVMYCVNGESGSSLLIESVRLEISRRTRWLCLKSVIVYLARDIPAFVTYCVNGESGSSLLIESTDSMIIESTDSMIYAGPSRGGVRGFERTTPLPGEVRFFQ